MCIEKYIQTKSYKILLGIGLIAIFFGSTVNSWAQNQRQTIQITTEFNYPYNFLDKDTGAISGRAADKVHEIFKRSQIPYRMQIMSWNRAFEMARGNADTCVFSTSRSGEREPFFHWIGPIAVGHWAIFGSPDKLGKITKLEDIKQSRIGTQFGTIGVAYLTERHFQVVTSTESIPPSRMSQSVVLITPQQVTLTEKKLLKIINLVTKWFGYSTTTPRITTLRAMHKCRQKSFRF